MDKALPRYGFAFTAADIDRGPVYGFKLNHVVHVDDPMARVRPEGIEPPGCRHPARL